VRSAKELIMTIALAIIGSIVVFLVAATEVPTAVAAFLRACIPLIDAFHELREAIRRHGSDKGQADE
jgi:hypothetical protein